MSEFFSLLFFIIIVMVVVKATKKGRTQSEQQRRELEQLVQRNQAAQQAGSAAPVNSHAQPSVGRTGSGGGMSPSHPAMQTRNAQQVRASMNGHPAPSQAKGASAVINGVLDVDGDGQISTTEYLAQKAREDEADHIRDEYETKQKLTQGGRLRLGGRIPDDGMLPRGTHLVYCSYCGAENVLAHNARQKDFHCYFCHETL